MEEAKDVFQQAVIIFYENIIYDKVSEITTKVKTYIFSIGKNKLLELLREKSRHQHQFNDLAFVDTEIYYDSFDDGYEDNLKKVEAGLIRLGDPCKSILEQYYYHKKSMQEISEFLEYKNSDTVKNLKYKCLQRLRQIFSSDFDVINEFER
jgi:RNA polymerase sigma-70 factor (ECF subfamily)